MIDNKKIILGLLIILLVVSAAFVLNSERKSEFEPLFISHHEVSIEEAILSSFRKGMAISLLPYLNEEVNLTIFHKEDIYTKTEAQEVLQLFFDSVAPIKMVKKHSGTSKGGEGHYLIAILTADSQEEYRCYFFINKDKIETIDIAVEKKACVKFVQ